MRTFSWRILVAATCLLTASAAAGLAHNAGQHGTARQKPDHLQAMYALKEKIPEEYRIMERTPIVPDEQSLGRGAELFAQQCAACHGPNGRGDGPAAKGLSTPPADFLDLDHSRIYGPGEKFWIVGNGSGETGMPPFPQISLIDRWHLVNYIYRLQENSGSGESQGHSH